MPGYDLARFVAVFGVVVVDMVLQVAFDFSKPGMIEDGPFLLAWGQRMWWGRASAMLAVVAGAGLGLMFKPTDDAETLSRKRRTVLKRALFLWVVGHLWHSSTLWEFSILHYYAFFLAFGVLFARTRPRALLGTAIGVMAVGVAYQLLYGEPPSTDLDVGWEDPLRMWELAYWNPVRQLTEVLLDGQYPVFPWLAFILIGMWVVRIGVDRVEVRRRVLGGSLFVMGVSFLAWWSVRQLTDDGTALFLTTINRDGSMPLYVLTAGCQAVVFLCLSMSVAAMWPSRRWMAPLIATGQMTFTIYIVHILVGGGSRQGLFDLVGFPPGEGLVAGWTRVAVFLSVAITACHLWKKRFGRGPLEALMRRCSDGRPANR
ncbi:MAG: hypothetical protein CMJ90_05305 [Planctomycetes bacterium]|nr:hypothetical protein [Planctomycetota bacterium]